MEETSEKAREARVWLADTQTRRQALLDRNEGRDLDSVDSCELYAMDKTVQRLNEFIDGYTTHLVEAKAVLAGVGIMIATCPPHQPPGGFRNGGTCVPLALYQFDESMATNLDRATARLPPSAVGKNNDPGAPRQPRALQVVRDETVARRRNPTTSH